MTTIKKVIYYDESTAMDFLQIESKGKLTKTTELMSTLEGGIDAQITGEVSLGKNGALKTIFEKMAGLSGGVSVSSKKNYLVDITENYTLEISENSMSYFAMIAPISEMMEGSQSIEGMENVSMSFSKLNSGIREIKGYFELLGYNKEHKIERIFRFNINSFKNNYRIHDLTKMTLKLYSIKVGETTIGDLDFESQFNLRRNHLSFSGISEDEKTYSNMEYPVYDVILAGVN